MVNCCFRMADGEPVGAYCRRNGFTYSSIYRRLDAGQSIEKAINEYTKRKGRKDHRNKYFYKGKKLTFYFDKTSTEYRRVYRLIYIKNVPVGEAVERVLNDVF